MTLVKAIDVCRAAETSSSQLKTLHDGEEKQVQFLKKKFPDSGAKPKTFSHGAVKQHTGNKY